MDNLTSSLQDQRESIETTRQELRSARAEREIAESRLHEAQQALSALAEAKAKVDAELRAPILPFDCIPMFSWLLLFVWWL